MYVRVAMVNLIFHCHQFCYFLMLLHLSAVTKICQDVTDSHTLNGVQCACRFVLLLHVSGHNSYI